MPELRPLRALRYDLRAVSDAGTLLCPPYDVISPSQRAHLAALDPRNAVHVELPQDASGRPDYEAAARRFDEWQAGGVLRRDERPAIYAYEQVYALPDGRRESARGFFCRLRLEPFGRGAGVRAHERTMSAPKRDRLQLLRAVNANLSPVLLLYETGDGGEASARLLTRLMSARPDLEARSADGSAQRLWAVQAEGSAEVAGLLALGAARPLTIADGHHRYETALHYRDERRAEAAGQPVEQEQPTDWLLVLLFDSSSGGLTVLPTHRFVLARREHGDVLAAAQQLFELEPVPSSAELLSATGQPGLLGMWSSAGGWLLRPRQEVLEPLLPRGASQALRWLDVTVLTSALPQLTGESVQTLLEDERLDYVKDSGEVLARAAASERGYAFLLPPTPIPAVLQVAAAGEQMPHKSTYFEPKPASGLVFNPLLP